MENKKWWWSDEGLIGDFIEKKKDKRCIKGSKIKDLLKPSQQIDIAERSTY